MGGASLLVASKGQSKAGYMGQGSRGPVKGHLQCCSPGIGSRSLLFRLLLHCFGSLEGTDSSVHSKVKQVRRVACLANLTLPPKCDMRSTHKPCLEVLLECTTNNSCSK